MNEIDVQHDDVPATANSPQPSSTQPWSRRPWVRLLLSLVIFGSGAVVGVGATLIVLRQQVLERIHHPEQMPTKVALRMRRMLDLDNQQTAQVEDLLVERQQAIQQIRREVQPRLMRELDQLEAEVAALLNERQSAEWQRRFAELRETWLPPVPQD